MARIPNQSDASSMWKANQQRNAAYGEEWPQTHVPMPAWAGDRYFSYSGYGSGGSGGYQIRYEYCNSVTLASAWTIPATYTMNWYMRWNYTGKMSNQVRIVNAGGYANWGSAINHIYYIQAAAPFYYSYAFGSVVPYLLYGGRGGSDGTTGIYGGGHNATVGAATSLKNKITIATTGTATTHGNLYATREQGGSASGATYFCTFGGSPWSTGLTNWDYETFATGGTSALAGNLEGGGSPRYNYNCDAIDGGVGSSRIVLAGGAWEHGGHGNAMFHYSTASFGVGTDYGNMANAREANSTTGNGTYGVIAGGQGMSAYESGSLIFNVGTLSLATVGANALNYGVTTNGMGAGNQ